MIGTSQIHREFDDDFKFFDRLANVLARNSRSCTYLAWVEILRVVSLIV